MDVDVTTSDDNEDNSTIDDDDMVTYTYPLLGKLLVQLNLQEYFDEIVEKATLSDDNDQCINIVSAWSVKDVLKFLRSCSFITNEIATSFSEEFIDGICLLNIMDCDCEVLKLNKKHYTLLSIIRDGWRFSFGSKLYHRKSIPSLVACGLMADLSTLPSELAERLHHADIDAAIHDKGKVYGELIVLGYKEFKYIGKEGYLPVGMNNEKFILERRKIPNGIITTMIANRNRIYDENDDRVQIKYYTDPSKDVFQIGRNKNNDFVVRGYCHENRQTKTVTGPTSRFACRIISDRLPPYKSFLCAAGLNEKNEIHLDDNNCKIISTNDNTFDILTSFGVKLYNPKAQKWAEISLNGNLYNIRKSSNEPGARMIDNEMTNELTDGSIIDLCGVSLLFLKSNQDNHSLNPEQIINEINALRPQCPVQLHPVQFQYLNPRQRAIRAIKNLESSMIGYQVPGCLHVPAVDFSDVEEQHRSYVFPGCGHVHGYHSMLISKPCPLCRTNSDFVPLAFDFQLGIDAKKPTHVFNPCGHVASESCCQYWSNIPQPIYEEKTKIDHLSPKCPFCGVELLLSSSGQSYNKLILQTESGKEWTDVIDKDKDNSSFRTITAPIIDGSNQVYNSKLFPKYAPQIGIMGI